MSGNMCGAICYGLQTIDYGPGPISQSNVKNLSKASIIGQKGLLLNA
jgi:hypothetical protein